MKKLFLINWQQLSGLGGTEANIHFFDYYIKPDFHLYNGEDPNLNEEYRIYITIKETATVLSAKLHPETYSASNIYTAILDRRNKNLRRRHGNQLDQILILINIDDYIII